MKCKCEWTLLKRGWLSLNLEFLSHTPGIGGTLKDSEEDFVVEEITLEGKKLGVGKKVTHPSACVGKCEYTHFVLEKKNWNTVQALSVIAKAANCSAKRFGYAGMKDRKAWTAQLCSAWFVPPEKLLSLKIKDMQINGAWKANHPVQLGDLSGNSFKISVRGLENATKTVRKIYTELNGFFPNYFGEQRFGSTRSNNHIVGKMLILGDLEGAVKNFLCCSTGEENKEAVAARKKLEEEWDFAAALEYFPMYLKYERAVISHLAEFKNDYAGALHILPRGISLIFVHAYQSWLFNEVLSKRVREGIGVLKGDVVCSLNKFGFPDVETAHVAKEDGEAGVLCLHLVGYETKPTKFEASVLAEEGIKIDDFRMKKIQELSSKGNLRAAFCFLKGFSFSQKKDVGVFQFVLPPGSYATTALREFIEKKE